LGGESWSDADINATSPVDYRPSVNPSACGPTPQDAPERKSSLPQNSGEGDQATRRVDRVGAAKMKSSAFLMVLASQLCPISVLAASSCDHFVLRGALTHCIDELQKEIERNRAEIQSLKTENTLISKKLCMLAIELHRSNANSEPLRLIIEDSCASLKNPTVSKKRL
jgi:hypothetical protein